jgi:hypothetical protein
MKVAWAQYFQMFSNYSIEVENIFENGAIVGIFGTAIGSYSASTNEDWKIPAAWRARVKNGKVALWQVYADNEPVWKVMGVKRD